MERGVAPGVGVVEMLDEGLFGGEEVAAGLDRVGGVFGLELDEVGGVLIEAGPLVSGLAVGGGGDAADGELSERAGFGTADEEAVFVEVAAQDDGAVAAEEF